MSDEPIDWEPLDWEPLDWDPAVLDRISQPIDLSGLDEPIDLSGLDAVLAEPAEPRAVFLPLDSNDGQIAHLRQLVRDYDQARRQALAALRAELQRRGYPTPAPPEPAQRRRRSP